MSSAARAPSVDELMGYHLQADVAHDFGPTAPVYNIGGTDAVTRVRASGTSEDAALDFFLNGPGGAIIADLAARKSGEIIFTVPDKTASFQNWKAPLLFQGGNDKIGIIQDAGEFITQRIGAANVIAFGSILDPAGKPIAPDQDPIWFQPAAAANQVDIPLEEFGFNPAVLTKISIRDLVAGSVKAIYETPGGMIDGVSMKPPGNQRGKAKPINTTDVDKAGFFTSIKKVENIDRELVTKGVFPNTSLANQFVQPILKYFYIGKTLGDAMLVASAMPKFGATPNPYYGIGASGWKSWSDGSAKPSPTLLALKTGDRLNWLRAIIKSVPTIYEDQAKGGRKTKQYRFFPGIADPRAVHTAIIEDFAKIKADVIRRYTEVSNNLGALLLQADLTIGRLTFARGAINPALTTFAPGGDKVIKTATGAALAGQLINNIRAGLLQQSGTTVTGGLCKLVLDWVDIRERAVRAIPLGSKNQEVRQIYEQTVERANAASPASSAIQIKKGSDLPYLTMKLLIANIPPGVKGYPLPISYDIALRNAFSALNGANAVTSTDYESRVTGTDIYNRFLSKLPASSSASSSAAPAPAPAPAPASSSGPTTRSMAAAAATAQRGGDPPTLDEAVQALLTDQIGEQTSTAISPPIAIADTVSEVVGATISDTPNLSEPRGTAATGGAVLMRVKLLVEPQEFPTILADAFPRIADFAAYANWYLNAEPTAETIRQRTSLVHPMVKEGATKQEVQAIIGQYAKIFLIIHDIVKKRNTGRVVDLELCNDLVAEFKTILKDPEPLVSAHEPRIEIKNVDTRIFDPNYGAPQTPATPIGENLFLATPLQVNSSTATVLFDAYTYYVNARNAYIPTGPDFKSVETQAVVDYQALEFAYLTKLAPVVSRLRSGKTLPFYEFEIEPPPVEAVIKAEESAAETEEGRVRQKRQLKEDRDMPPDRRARETTGSMNIEPSMLPSSASSSSSEPLIGGLRDRRPLYAKNVRSSGTLGDDNGGDNQGLRKRSRARATPRVRKHSRGSKTRRQRKYVDRV